MTFCQPILQIQNTQNRYMQSLDIEALNQQIYIDSAFVEQLNNETITTTN